MSQTTPNTVDALMELVMIYAAKRCSTPVNGPECKAAYNAVEASARALAAIPADSVVAHGLEASGVAPQKSTDVSHNAAQQAGGVPAGWRETAELARDALTGGHAGNLSADGQAKYMRAVQALDNLLTTPSPSAVQPPDSVKMPTTADEAALMTLLGTAWLKEHAPERLKPVAVQPLSEAQRDEIRREVLNTPEVRDFATGVVLEALHQRGRWGAEHDAGKEPADWFWLVGYLAGKALHAQTSGNAEKAMHHTISTAAALANWHAAITGTHTAMRPGIDPAAHGIVTKESST